MYADTSRRFERLLYGCQFGSLPVAYWRGAARGRGGDRQRELSDPVRPVASVRSPLPQDLAPMGGNLVSVDRIRQFVLNEQGQW